MQKFYRKAADLCRSAVRSTRAGRFISDNPFSVLALTSMFGDACYTGYALHAPNGFSLLRLIGSISALTGNTLVLAYGDAQAKRIETERGWAARLFLYLRRHAQSFLHILTESLHRPLFKGFALMSLNGVFLMLDALASHNTSPRLQIALGLMVLLGCGSFALADLVTRQSTADRLTKLAPMILTCANLPGLLLGIATLNIFLLVSTGLFLIGNLAGYFTRIDKSRPIVDV